MSDTPSRADPTNARGESVDPASAYARLGGDTGVRELTRRFYELMDTLPEAAAIRAMHPNNLRESEQKLYEFLSGFLGGPPLYWQRRGHPRLRMRHQPFAIDTRAAQEWMLCMQLALAESTIEDPQRSLLEQRFAQVAGFMRNQEEAAGPR